MRSPKYTDGPARFVHVDLHKTDLKATFARARREMKQAEQVDRARVEQEERERHQNVSPITNHKRKA